MNDITPSLVSRPLVLQVLGTNSITYEPVRHADPITFHGQAGRKFTPTHCDPGCVDKTLVEMVQCRLGLFLRLEADEAKFAELAIFGELQATVCQCAEGSEQLPETLLLHPIREVLHD